MTLQQKKERAQLVIAALKDLYPDAACALQWGDDPWRLLVMGRLSAQCTDKRVNEVAKDLFVAFPTAQDMAAADVEQIEQHVKPCGLYHMKARDLKESARQLVDTFGGELPHTMEELLTLAGVGRKIANLLLGDVFGQPSVVTDTHCIRICGRLGFYPEKEKTPQKIEKILREILPPEESSDFCHRIVEFGRDVCMARSPKCEDCLLGARGLCEKHTKAARKKAAAEKGAV